VIADLIATYNKEREVWVELGLQTASDATAKIINRGYTTDVFLRAIKILASRKVKTVVHLMIGLPGEGDAELADTVRLINSVEPFGVKIHSVYVSRGTVLEKMYDEGKYTPISLEDYTRRAAYVISHISAETVIHRLTGDCPVGLLRAPDWNTKKSEVIAKIAEKLDTGGVKQGSYYKKGEDR
jgi:radical SAM protein (TIGR01212 family)